MNSAQYISLNSWLSNADMLYLDGRILWLKWGIGGSCILLWLSVEQILKVLIFQSKINSGELDTTDLEKIFNQFDTWGIGINHGLDDLLVEFSNHYPKVISDNDKKTLKKLSEYYNRRYIKNTSTSIEIKLLHSLDDLYFRLRSLITDEMPMAFIDEIQAAKDKKYPFVLTEYTQHALIDNPYFRGREKYRT